MVPTEHASPLLQARTQTQVCYILCILAHFLIWYNDSGCLLAGDVDDHFRIGAESGVLFTRRSLDREMQNSYLLSVQARDSAGGNSLSSVTQVRSVRGTLGECHHV